MNALSQATPLDAESRRLKTLVRLKHLEQSVYPALIIHSRELASALCGVIRESDALRRELGMESIRGKLLDAVERLT